MTELFNITHETGDFSQYTSYEDDLGHMTVEHIAGLGGTAHGMQCSIQDTAAMYGFKSFTRDSYTYEIRFYFNSNSVVIPTTQYIRMFHFQQRAGAYNGILAIYLYWTIANGYRVLVGHYIDPNTMVNTYSDPISNGEHCVEFKIVSESTDGAADGTIDWWIDGVAQTQITGIANYLCMHDQTNVGVYLGVTQVLTGTYSGNLYCDELVMNNNGTYIGELAGCTVETITEVNTVVASVITVVAMEE